MSDVLLRLLGDVLSFDRPATKEARDLLLAGGLLPRGHPVRPDAPDNQWVDMFRRELAEGEAACDEISPAGFRHCARRAGHEGPHSYGRSLG
jgi:hypothetical protein